MCNLEKLFVFSLGAAVYINYWSLAYLDHHCNSTLLSLMRFFFLLSHTQTYNIIHTYIHMHMYFSKTFSLNIFHETCFFMMFKSSCLCGCAMPPSLHNFNFTTLSRSNYVCKLYNNIYIFNFIRVHLF